MSKKQKPVEPPKAPETPKPKIDFHGLRHNHTVEELKALLKRAIPCIEEYGDLRGGDHKWRVLLSLVHAAVNDRKVVEVNGVAWCDHYDTMYREPCRKCVPNANDIDLWIAA